MKLKSNANSRRHKAKVSPGSRPSGTVQEHLQSLLILGPKSAASRRQRREFIQRANYLFEGYFDRSPDQVNLTGLAQKIYRLEFTRDQREELCRAAQGFFVYCLRKGDIDPRFHELVMTWFWAPENPLPPGVMSLDQIRTALHQPPSVGARLLLINALNTDVTRLALEKLTLEDFMYLRSRPATRSPAGRPNSLDAWLNPLPVRAPDPIRPRIDYGLLRETLEGLGFKKESPAEVFKRTQNAYRAVMLDMLFPRSSSQRAGGAHPPSASPALDLWSSSIFEWQLTPESVGIGNWAKQVQHAG